MRKAIFSSLALAVCTAGAHATLIFASAEAPSVTFPEGPAVEAQQFVGARFMITSAVQVTAIGGFFAAFGGQDTDMFGMIMSLDSLSSLPTGDPFDAADLARVKVSTVATVSAVAAMEYQFPASTLLEPGAYGLIFGKGQFGATPGGIAVAKGGFPSLSPDSMFWNDVTATVWRDEGFVSHWRLTVYGDAVPEPSAAVCALLGIFPLALRRLRADAPA